MLLEGKVKPQDKAKDPYMTNDFGRLNTGSDDENPLTVFDD
jgi:hypothetical protein